VAIELFRCGIIQRSAREIFSRVIGRWRVSVVAAHRSEREEPRGEDPNCFRKYSVIRFRRNKRPGGAAKFVLGRVARRIYADNFYELK